MKKLITSVLVAATLVTSVTPAMAGDRHDRRDRYEHRYDGDRHHRKRGGSDAGKIILGIIGGAIIASAISDSNRDRRRYSDEYYDDPYADDRYTMPRRARYYEHYCVTEQMVDRYGEVYFRRTCQ